MVGGRVEPAERRRHLLGRGHDPVGLHDPVEPAGGHGIRGRTHLGEADRTVERGRCEAMPQDRHGRDGHGQADGHLVGLQLEVAGAPTR